MTAGDTFHIRGGMTGRPAVAFLGGDTDDAVQIDSFMAARVLANDTTGTFSAWFNVADIVGDYAILGGGDASAVEAFYVSCTAGEIRLYAIDGVDVSYDMITIGAGIVAHSWHHVTIVQDAVKPKIYVDGVEFSANKGTLTETDVTEPTLWFDFWSQIDGGSIGAADSVAGAAALTLEMKGAVGETKYWDAALTSAEVLENYLGRGQTTDLIAKWDMINDLVDSVGGEDGAIVGQVIIQSNYSEFASRFAHELTPAVVADEITFSVDNNTGYAIIIKAA